VARISAKTPIGSLMRSADWEKVPLALRERAQFSAGVTSARLLQTIQDRIQGQLKLEREKLGSAGLRPGETAIFDRSSFIDAVRQVAIDEGLQPPASDATEGTLRDITSIPRLGLIYDMQNSMAQGFARWKMDQMEGALLLYPAWEFVRTEDRNVPREQLLPGFWARRWLEAAKAAGDQDALRVFADTQRKIALKGSGIWARLSRFGTPWPPYDWGSGMGVDDVDRDTAIALGLMQPTDQPPSGEQDFNDNLQASVKGLTGGLLDALGNFFGNQITFADGTAKWQDQAAA
jgi:hypothetical protein